MACSVLGRYLAAEWGVMMSRKLFLLLFALLAAMVLPVGSSVLAQSGTPRATELDYGDNEPNDTPAQAVPMQDYTWLSGQVSQSDLFDYYSFTVEANESVLLHNPYGFETPDEIPTLLDSSLNPIVLQPSPAESPRMAWAFLPNAGTYYLGITRAELSYDRDYYYAFDHLTDIDFDNTPAQATPVALGGHISGDLWLNDIVDYYTFTGVAGDTIALIEPEGYQSNWNVFVTMLDASLNEIPLQPHSNWAVLPANGTYYFKVTGQYYQPYNPNDYDYHFVKLEGAEPNDTFATAMPVDALATIQGTWDYDCDVDMYRFEGRAGDVFPIPYEDGHNSWDRDYDLYDATGTLLDRVLVLPANGTYYLKMLGWWWTDDDGGCLYAGDDYTVTIGYPLWVSSSQNGLPTNGGTPITSADIVMRAKATGKWRLVFDASDVGITTNVDAFERLVDGSILMSLGAAQNVAGLGKVMPQDIIRFIPTSLGNSTDGTFEWYLDGSDVGLTTAAENIDAIYMKPDDKDLSPLVVSLTGNGSVPRQSGGTLTVKDEDLITFVGTAYGQVTAGKWRMNLDGSTYTGMAAEDISASTMIKVYPDRNSRLLTVFNSAFNITGIKGGPQDVVEIDPPQPDLNDSIVIKKLTTKPIDGLTVGVDVP